MSTSHRHHAEAKARLGDVLFAGIARGAGVVILLALAGVAIFLTVRGLSRPSPRAARRSRGADDFLAYVWPLVFGTLLAAALALLIATPLAIGVALVISHYAPAGSPARSAT